MHSPPLPVSARFALWFSAWVTGRCSLDDARDAIVGTDAAHDVVGLPGSPDSTPLIMALGLLRPVKGATVGLMLKLGMMRNAADDDD